MKIGLLLYFLLPFFTVMGHAVVASANEESLAPAMHSIDVQEHLGDKIDLTLRFVDHHNQEVALGDYFDGKRPILLTLNYYRCPVLCNVQLNGLTDALRNLEWTPGDEHFRIVTLSIDPRETADLAAKKRTAHLDALDRGDSVDWEFLTGDGLQTRLLASQLGIGYAYDSEQDQYAHPAAIVFISPDGTIARYVYGLTYEAKDLKFALIEAGEGRIGSTLDRMILSCFHYDATLGRYGPFAFGIMRLGASIMVIVVAIFLITYWRRERRQVATLREA